MLLVQECIYTTDLDSKDEQRKKERLVMAEAIDKEDADVGDSDVVGDDDEQDVPPLGLVHCKKHKNLAHSDILSA